jgi:hypothetical protein
MSKPTLCTKVRHAKRRVREAVVPSVASLAVGLSLGMASTPGNAATETDHVRQYRQCAQEDGPRCVWRNHGPGFSYVSAGGWQDRNPRVWPVSDRLADELISRHGTWKHAPRGVRWDTVGRCLSPCEVPLRSFVTGKRAVVSYVDGTAYVIRWDGTVGAS